MKKRIIMVGIIILILVVAIASVFLIAGVGREKVYEPTFMYFVSNADEETVTETIDKLKAEFEGRVIFDIINVDENPDAKENFPIDENTPMLIMLNTKNDISALAPKCTGYDELKAQIEKALAVEE